MVHRHADFALELKQRPNCFTSGRNIYGGKDSQAKASFDDRFRVGCVLRWARASHGHNNNDRSVPGPLFHTGRGSCKQTCEALRLARAGLLQQRVGCCWAVVVVEFG